MRFRPLPEFSEFPKKTLLVPALGVGNAGQLALDIICHTASIDAEEGNVVILGHALSRNLLPMAATNDAFLSPRLSGSGCLTGITVYGLPGSAGVVVLQVRSAIVSGREQAFAEEVASFAREHGFGECACLAAADPIFLSAGKTESSRAFHMSTTAGRALASRAEASGSQVSPRKSTNHGGRASERREHVMRS